MKISHIFPGFPINPPSRSALADASRWSSAVGWRTAPVKRCPWAQRPPSNRWRSQRWTSRAFRWRRRWSERPGKVGWLDGWSPKNGWGWWENPHELGVRPLILQTPRFAQAQTSVNTREFCTMSNNRKDLMFNYVARVLTRTCCFYISYGINYTLIRVSLWVSWRYQNPPAPWNNQPYTH